MIQNKAVKSFICAILLFCSMMARAQVQKLQDVIKKIEDCKNFSYKSLYKQKDPSVDTLFLQHDDEFIKVPYDKNYGYLFRLRTTNLADNSTWTDLYNGLEVLHIVPKDSSYEVSPFKASIVQGSLMDRLKWIFNFVEKQPTKLSEHPDTIINSRPVKHLLVNTRDTIIAKERCYTQIHVFIEKASGLPVSILTRSRNEYFGNGINDYYAESYYYDYKLNQDSIDLTKPKGLHAASSRHNLPLLAKGTTAPDWKLVNTQGKKVTLSQLKGKVVMLDFYFIGCIPCMQTIKPLNRLYERYKRKKVIISSITGRDGLKEVLKFDKAYHIRYPGFVDAYREIEAYHVESFPTFYFIDKKGNVAAAMIGYDSDFEIDASALIDRLLKE